MGAMFETFTTEDHGNTDLKRVYHDEVETACHENGHGGYSGTFAESPGLTIRAETFHNGDAAYEFLEENTRKWENAWAVRFTGEDNALYWLVGGWFSS